MNAILRSIAAELNRQGRTPSELAREIGMQPKHIYRLLSGERAPSSDVAAAMMKALGLRIVRK